jgi:large subunit ribosomal protein L30
MATQKNNSAQVMVKVQYYKSAIGYSEAQKRVVKGLGFRKLNSVREIKDTPELRGMVRKIPHLVRVLESEE